MKLPAIIAALALGLAAAAPAAADTLEALLADPAPAASDPAAPAVRPAERAPVPVVPAAPPALRNNVVVDGAYVRLGDLFDNVGAKAGTIVARAPEPGRRAVFDAYWLYRLARTHGLGWQPLSSHVNTVVERGAQVILRDEVEETVVSALADKGIEGDLEVVLSNRALRLYVAENQPAAVEVEDIYHDPRTGRFTATLLVPAGDPAATRTQVSGRVYRMVEVPVLAENKHSGQVIAEHDLVYKQVRASLLHKDAVTETAELIGMTPRRSLQADRTIRRAEIQEPVLVGRRSVVTMVLRTPTMTLTAQGRAVEDGAMGQAVRVTNLQSNTIVEAEVIGPNTVAVTPAARVAMN